MDHTVLVLGRDAPEGTRPFTPEPSPMNTARAQALELAAGVHSDDIVTICWTSGTEGVPKGVPRSHNHWIAGSLCHFDGAQIRPGDRLLNPFPLVNMAALGGCFMSWLRAAGTLVLHHPFELPVYLAADRAGEAGVRDCAAGSPDAVTAERSAAERRGLVVPALHRLGLRAAPARDDQDLQGAVRHRDHQ